MKYFLITITGLALLTFSASQAQINQTIEFHTFDQIGLRYAPRIISGTVYFESLPEPLKKTRVRFEIYFNSVANYIGDNPLERDTLVHIAFEEYRVEVSDTLFVWPAPIYTNEPFKGEFEITPLMAGNSSFAIHLIDQRFGALGVSWTFDVDGNLLYLGNPADTTQKGTRAYKGINYPAIFFEGDSIAFEPYPASNAPPYDALRFACVITPVPRIGDTSYISCRVNAIKSIADSVRIELRRRGISVLGEPTTAVKSLTRGEEEEFRTGFVPLAVNGPQYLSFTFRTVETEQQQVIPLDFVFNNDSTLRFIGNLFNYGDHPPDSYLPTAFQSMEVYEAARKEEKRKVDSIKNAGAKRF
ncbi:MAG: hypothetical protein RBT76_04260 [candidate division Zixibacteria bacterium]|jgi:hypothetical protein|nr:hypothetical protein [candidate division Zixibacteria bacterium]